MPQYVYDKEVHENETLSLTKRIIISPTYQKHFQESRPKTKCIIENFANP